MMMQYLLGRNHMLLSGKLSSVPGAVATVVVVAVGGAKMSGQR